MRVDHSLSWLPLSLATIMPYAAEVVVAKNGSPCMLRYTMEGKEKPCIV